MKDGGEEVAEATGMTCEREMQGDQNPQREENLYQKNRRTKRIWDEIPSFVFIPVKHC